MQHNGIKKLLVKLALLVSPFIVWPLVEATVLPIDFFTFRIWEAISVNSMRVMSGPFYPNQHMAMEEEGELAPHTPFATKHKVVWYTDAYGYRNRDTKCDVLLIGDSNITGSKLSQDETLAEVLERQLNKEVYSFAPATINRFLAADRFKQDAPELVIVSSIERRIPTLPPVGDNTLGSRFRNYTGNIINESPALTYLAITADRISKLGLYHRLQANIERSFGKKEYIAYNNEFFLEGDTANRAYTNEEIQQIADVLEGYKHAVEERGIRFMFMPIPNKENIYYKLLPSQKKPDFLPRLIAELRKRDVHVVDMQHTFAQLYEKEKIQLFPVDDAHWNGIAVKVASEHVLQSLDAIQAPENKNEQNYLVKYNR